MVLPFEWKISINFDEYYFDSKEDLDNCCRELFIANKTFELYHLEYDEDQENKGIEINSSDYKLQNLDPYDLFDTIDDTPYPTAHGQFLPHFSGLLTPMQIWQLSQGNEGVIEEIEDESLREKATSIFERLESIGVWKEQEQEDDVFFSLKSYNFV